MITFSESQQKIVDALKGETIEQDTIPLSVLQEIRNEIDSLLFYCCEVNPRSVVEDCLEIIDKHIKEVTE